ncbi:MAG TPA: PQQ-binding-like beta-propeller repeat protein [Vicinamibacterales bacterium]|nr:PQQ-binding-like beta-propeller repeat protein [Vicinamibacterales bacterium]
MRTLLISGVALSIAGLVAVGSSEQEQPPADWPQWGGPTRDFQAPTARVTVEWPADGPRRVWTRSLGEGYSAIAVVGDTLYTMVREGDHEVVVALDEATGATRWEHRYPAPWFDGMNSEQGPGPHATALVHRGRVYAAGATGILHALEAVSGRVLWRHRLIEDLGGSVVGRGYSSSPLAHGDRVVVQVGGDGQAVMAFDAADGRSIWQGGSFENGNSSPILVRVDGEDQVVALGSGEVIGLDAGTGDTRWRHPHPHRFGDNIPTPVWGDGLLFVTSYADGGSRVLALSRPDGRVQVDERWHHTRLRVYYTNVLRVGDVVYGSSGDLGPTVFTAANVHTGEVLWQSREVGRSSGVAVRGRLLLRDDEGRLLVVDPTGTGPTVLASARVLEPGPPTPPTVRGSRVYLRDRRTLTVLDLRDEPRRP